MFRTDAARRAGGYAQGCRYGQDLALWIAMLADGCKAASISEFLSAVRMHPGQTSRSLARLVMRTEDNHRLATAMLAIPGLAPSSRQAACFRGAAALFRLGRKKEALTLAWKGLRENPLGTIVNPLLHQRLRLEITRRLRARSRNRG